MDILIISESVVRMMTLFVQIRQYPLTWIRSRSNVHHSARQVLIVRISNQLNYQYFIYIQPQLVSTTNTDSSISVKHYSSLYDSRKSEIYSYYYMQCDILLVLVKNMTKIRKWAKISLYPKL